MDDLSKQSRTESWILKPDPDLRPFQKHAILYFLSIMDGHRMEI